MEPNEKMQPGGHGAAATVTLPAAYNVGYESLRLLAIYRTAIPLLETATVVLSVYALRVQLPLAPVSALIALQAFIAAATWARLRSGRAVSMLELFVHVHIDIATTAGMLYFTGGTTNPFAALFLLPVALAASSLNPRSVCITVASTAFGYLVLTYFYVPLAHVEGPALLDALRERATVASYLFTAALIAYLVAKIRLELQHHGSAAAEVHERQMRSESSVAMGAFAADCAHQLSSPLGTMAVVVTELQRERAGDATLQENLRLVNDQIEVVKQVISNLTGAAGQRRAEAAGIARLDQFMSEIVEHARALYPGATLHAQIGNGKSGPRIVAEETLRQAFANLVDNAVRASPDYVEISADWSTEDLVVTVSDRGPGFPPEILGRLGKAMPTLTALDSGPGLGLPLTNATLGRLGGSLTLHNKPQTGACAEVRLPLHAILFDENGIGNGRTIAQ